MKLSEAMMLGSVTCKMVIADWNSCALGCAGNAVGIPQMKGSFANECNPARFGLIARAFPWLSDTENPTDADDGNHHALEIWSTFDNQVCKGEMTFEQLVDRVRSIEPSCGDCNRFECACKSPAIPDAELIEAKVS